MSASIKKVVASRRVSEVFLGLPRVSGPGIAKAHKESLEMVDGKRNMSLGREDLRQRRLQLRSLGTNRRGTQGERGGETVSS